MTEATFILKAFVECSELDFHFWDLPWDRKGWIQGSGSVQCGKSRGDPALETEAAESYILSMRVKSN